jgi:hypothetical protein
LLANSTSCCSNAGPLRSSNSFFALGVLRI